MIQIILTVGLPASGKSTWAKAECLKNRNFVRVNKDDIRAMLSQLHSADFEREVVLATRDTLIKQFIEMGRSIIIDDTNFHIKHLKAVIKIARDYNKLINIQIKWFNTDLATCVKRNETRDNSIPEKAIRDMDANYSGHKLGALLAEMNKMCADFNSRDVFDKYVPPKDKPLAVICDLDGTLAIIGDRSPYDASSCEKDLLNEPVADVLSGLSNMGCDIILLSGREDKDRLPTERWLASHDIEYDHLFMRKAGDPRSDRIIKHELFQAHIEKNYKVLASIDDRPQMTRMWKELGLFCFDVYQDPDRKNF
ncbi:MAG: AAA family ATPase [Candidatus Pacearchaeota archaeon]